MPRGSQRSGVALFAAAPPPASPFIVPSTTQPAAPPAPSARDANLAIDRRSLNLPNLITLFRFVLAIVLFVLMDLEGFWRISALVFVVAALSDVLDGWIARKYGLVTTLGRIMDPFVDKLIICGAFLFLLGKPESGISPWIAFIVMAREMYITSLRAFLEQHGRDFSAKFWGKLKMALQCAAVPLCLLSLSPVFQNWIGQYVDFQHYLWLRDAVIYAMTAVTVYSGIEYSWRAFLALRNPAAA
ncbi:MAG: CDP-diacylglycerol--glycerol-3-phosphate 3-phosphatidyltransferase [Planctomyces sp.]|nr:CDP-diacylglycerol--glycerol-3-phosphate 3-phosphatidyltransferase [Planctomyces sp.]